MADQQKVTLKLSRDFSESDRKAIAEEIIVYIQERAINKNTGFNPSTGREKKFAQYSKKYAAKKGVGRGDVDLVLSAEMMNAMRALDIRKSAKDEITVGYAAGDKINGKVEGNQLGTYGQATPVTEPRHFLGLPIKVLREIEKKYDV
jgi:hypothetical protein